MIVLHDPADAVRVADDKEPLPEQAALDEQLLEQFLVAGRQRILLRDAQQSQRRQAPARARRHRGQGRERRLSIDGGHPGAGSPLRQPDHRSAHGGSGKHRRPPRDCPAPPSGTTIAPGYSPADIRQWAFASGIREGERHGQEDRRRRDGRGRRLYRGAHGQGRRGFDLYRFLARARRDDQTGRADDHASPGRGTVRGAGARAAPDRGAAPVERGAGRYRLHLHEILRHGTGRR